MAIINFSVPSQLQKRIEKAMQEKGFPSKAELFRFAVIRYLDEEKPLPLDANSRITALSQQLEKELNKKKRVKQFPSLKKQLANIKHL